MPGEGTRELLQNHSLPQKVKMGSKVSPHFKALANRSGVTECGRNQISTI